MFSSFPVLYTTINKREDSIGTEIIETGGGSGTEVRLPVQDTVLLMASAVTFEEIVAEMDTVVRFVVDTVSMGAFLVDEVNLTQVFPNDSCSSGYGDRDGGPPRGPPPPYGEPYNDQYGPGGGPHGPPGRGPNPHRRERRRRDEGPPGVSLLVRNVSPDITQKDLQQAFGRIGDVRDVYIPRDFHSQQPKGFAFIEYANPDMAREARDEMDRFRVKGRELEVVFAQERRKTPNEMRGRVVNQQNRGGRGRENFER